MATWTPWGTADSIETLQRGVSFVSTPGHGGYRVAAGILQRACRQNGVRFTCTHADKKYVYFEEDCEWAFVALAFPHLFKAELQQEARETIQRYWPNLAARYSQAA